MASLPKVSFEAPLEDIGLSNSHKLKEKNNESGLVGPFFLGFLFSSFAMGIVITLAVGYFVSVCSAKSAVISRKINVVLVATSVLFNLAQTVVDGRRGWTMFVTNFLDLRALLSTNYLSFLSPFFGIIPATITQSFLLRRSILFIYSLSDFWPRLAHPVVRWGYGGIMVCLILNASIAGTFAATAVAQSEGLWMLKATHGVSSRFQNAELNWLATSTTVDVILCTILCLEMWWARGELSAETGAMRGITERLLVVTLTGTLVVTGVQLSVLCIYRFAQASGWSTFPMLWLPKVYTITLIISLSVQGQDTAHGPSHIFSLPAITTQTHIQSASAPVPSSGPPVLRQHSPIDGSAANGDEKERRRRNGWILAMLRTGWQRSQGWIKWSLVGGLSDHPQLDVDIPQRAGRCNSYEAEV